MAATQTSRSRKPPARQAITTTRCPCFIHQYPPRAKESCTNQCGSGPCNQGQQPDPNRHHPPT